MQKLALELYDLPEVLGALGHYAQHSFVAARSVSIGGFGDEDRAVLLDEARHADLDCPAVQGVDSCDDLSENPSSRLELGRLPLELRQARDEIGRGQAPGSSR